MFNIKASTSEFFDLNSFLIVTKCLFLGGPKLSAYIEALCSC